MDRAILRVSAPDRVRRVERSRAGVVERLGRLRLPGRREGRQRAARLRQRAPARERSSLEQQQPRTEQLQRLLQLRDSTPGETVSAQVIGKDFTEFFRVTRIVLDRGARDVRPAHARRRARRRGRRRACTSLATRSTYSSPWTQRSASTWRTSAPTRVGSCAARAIRRATPARSRWSTRATRWRSAISSSRAARASGFPRASPSRA